MPINYDPQGQFFAGALKQMNTTKDQMAQQQGIDTQNRMASVQEKTFDFNKVQKEKEAFQSQFKSALDQAVGVLNATQDPLRRQGIMQGIQHLADVYTGPVAQQYGLAETNKKMVEFALQNPSPMEAAQLEGQMNVASDPFKTRELDIRASKASDGGDTSSSGGTGTERIADRLMKENPNMTYNQAISLAKKGLDEGFYINDSGVVTTMPSQKSFDVVNGTITKIDNLLADENLSAVTGIRNPLKGALPMGVNIGYAKDVKEKIDQLRGLAFLDAFERLKGGGPISNVEGEKAQTATARLSEGQTDEQFIQSVKEWRDTMVAFQAAQEAKKIDNPGMNLPMDNKPFTGGGIDLKSMTDEDILKALQ